MLENSGKPSWEPVKSSLPVRLGRSFFFQTGKGMDSMANISHMADQQHLLHPESSNTKGPSEAKQLEGVFVQLEFHHPTAPWSSQAIATNHRYGSFFGNPPKRPPWIFPKKRPRLHIRLRFVAWVHKLGCRPWDCFWRSDKSNLMDSI